MGTGGFFNAGCDVELLAADHINQMVASIFTGRDAGYFSRWRRQEILHLQAESAIAISLVGAREILRQRWLLLSCLGGKLVESVEPSAKWCRNLATAFRCEAVEFVGGGNLK